ncbi:MAG: restriction endonuclease subunit S [Planctomycetota bacterium]
MATRASNRIMATGCGIPKANLRAWQQASIGQLDHFLTSGSRGWARYYSEQGDSFLRIGNLSRDSIELVLEDCCYVQLPISCTEGRRTRLQHGDILVSITADLGMVAYYRDDCGESGAYVSQHIALLRVSDSRVCSEFLAYQLSSATSQKHFRKITDQGAKSGLGLGAIRAFPVSMPPRDEQQAITNVLGCWDEAIRLYEEKIEKKRAVKRGLMQRLLTGKTRLSGFSSEWAKKTLGSITDISMGQSPPSSSYNQAKQGYPLLQGNQDLVSGLIFPRVWTTQPRKWCSPGDLILTVRAPVGEVAMATMEACIGRGVCSMQPKSVNRLFLFHFLDFNRAEWRRLEQGSTFSAVSGADIRSLGILLPNPREQKAISDVISAASYEIDLLAQKLTDLRSQKRYLLNNLVTGAMRLPQFLPENTTEGGGSNA